MSTPTTKEAKALAQKHDRDVLIVFSVGPDGRLHYASYGKDPRHCKVARHLADEGFVAIRDTIQDFEPETTPGFRIEHGKFGAAVYGEVPSEKMGELQEHLQKHRGLNILDSEIADELGATLVFTTNDKHKQWRRELGIPVEKSLEPVYID